MIRSVTFRFNALRAVVPKRTALVVVPDAKPNNNNNSNNNGRQRAQQKSSPREHVKSATSINTSNSHIDFEPTPINFEDLIGVSEPQPVVPVQQQQQHHGHRDHGHGHRGDSKHKIAQAQASAVPAATIAPATPTAYQGIAQEPFSKEATDVLLGAIDPADVEIKPDGTVYMPEIKYRRRLNQAFGPGAWAMKPVGSAVLTEDLLSRTYQLFCLGRFVAEATGEQRVRHGMTQATAEEAAKSNALMRCCKDLGIASELWDPSFIGVWRAEHAVEVWCVNQRSNEKRQLWRKKNAPAFPFPWKENK